MKNEKILQILKDVTFDKMGIPSFNSNCICDDIEFAIFELEHPPIGIKDINDKPIYADSSIVEFNYTSGKKQWGYFKYNNERASYDLISGDITLNYSYNFRQINNIKIIDTIQENKLGLKKG